MERIKFCHVIDAANFNPLLFNSLKYSDRTKFDYSIICLGATGPLEQQVKELGIPFRALNYRSKKQAVSIWWKLYRYFRNERTRIVQTHLFTSSIIGLSAAKFAGVPVRVFTGHHSHEVPLYKRKMLTFADGINGRWLSNHSIAPSEDMRSIFINEEKVPAHKVTVIPHGFDLERWRQEAGAGAALGKEFNITGKTIFGATGRLFWVKDFETLIKSFARFAGNRNDVALLIAGDGGDKAKLQQLIDDLAMKGKIILMGRRTDIAAVMNSFDVFVHTSLAESFGMVYIEAFALGKPVISTPVGVAPDIIKDENNGLLFPSGDTEALASAFRQMMDRKDQWASMGERNKKIADGYAVQRTQALCDSYYLNWLEKK